MSKPIRIQTNYYQHFDANFDLPVPEAGFGGWKKADLEFPVEHTGVVVMHAWDCGTKESSLGGTGRCRTYRAARKCAGRSSRNC